MMKLAALALVLPGVAAAGFIEDQMANGAACYEQFYGDGVNPVTPGALISSLRIEYDYTDAPHYFPNALPVLVTITSPARSEFMSIVAECVNDDDTGAACAVAGDNGGSFALLPADGDAIQLVVGAGGLTVEGRSDVLTIHQDDKLNRNQTVGRIYTVDCI